MLFRMAKRPDELIGISVKEIVRAARVDPSTARRWKRGAVPVPAGKMLAIQGDLGYFDPDWSGWVIRRGVLISPEGWEAKPGHILAMRFHTAQVQAYRLENKALRSELARLNGTAPWLDEQPLPDQWDEVAKSQVFLNKI